MARPRTNLEGLMQTPTGGTVDDSIQSADPIRAAIRRACETMTVEEQFHTDALFIERTTVRVFAHRIGVSKSQAQRIKNQLAARLRKTLLTEPLIESRIVNMFGNSSITKPATWQEAVSEALILIEESAAFSPIENSYDSLLEPIVGYVVGGHKAVSILKVDEAIMDMAISAWLWMTEESRNKMFPLMVDRQRKYGTGNILKFGTKGIIIRMSDKVERLKNLGGEFVDDSIEDAHMDIVGYACLHWMCANDVFELPLDD